MMDYAALPPREIEKLAHTIHPGGWAVATDRPLATLLGSCVAVCLFDTGARIAGMNHFMLPDMRRSRHRCDNLQLAGDACMTALLDAVLARGADRRRLAAKAFGGGKLFDDVHGTVTVGQRNVDFALAWLQRERIPLAASDFLGPWGRKVLLLPLSGEAFCRKINARMKAAATVRREEADYARTLRQAPADPTRIELF